MSDLQPARSSLTGDEVWKMLEGPQYREAVKWHAEIRAPQAGPVYVHHEEGDDIFGILERIAESYDFGRADSVTITITRGEQDG